eukprot:symbB.v1.2.030545.t1/scaffold3453.1/size56350/5
MVTMAKKTVLRRLQQPAMMISKKRASLIAIASWTSDSQITNSVWKISMLLLLALMSLPRPTMMPSILRQKWIHLESQSRKQ